ncbi:ABC transporter substrate-binding protein [candidate division KSB1 bacterium]|nr:ABC transporter substrate-binding protein [candidate division KSB1 bacterium]
MKNYFLLLIGFFACFSLQCRRTVAPAKDSIVIAVENDIQTLDPTDLSDPYTSCIVWQIYEGLLFLDDDGQPQNLLAESWSVSKDFKTWTFKIRPNVYYHPSEIFPDSTRTMTAFDVKYSYTRSAQRFGSFVFSGLVEGVDDYIDRKSSDVSGFEVVDSLTFCIRLLHPLPTFIYRLTSPYLGIFPPEAIEKKPKKFGESFCSGTGPFKFRHRTETSVVLGKNDNYWRPVSGNLETIRFRVEKNAQFRMTQFKNGHYDLLQLPLQFIPRFGPQDSTRPSKYKYYSKTTLNVHYLGINCEKITDVHLRRAIGYAIDKKAIVETFLYGQGLPASGPVLPGLQGYLPPPGLPYAPDSAKFELAKSTYADEPIILLVSDAPNSEQLGQIVQSQLHKIGVNVKLRKFDFNTQLSRLFTSEKPDMFIMFSEWVFAAPEFLVDSYHSQKIPNPNLFGYRNSVVDRMLDKIFSTDNRDEINSLCFRAERIALNEVPAVWLFHYKKTFIMNKSMEGFSVNAHNHWNLDCVSIGEN